MTDGQPILCACGCGGEVRRRRFPSQPQPRFINRHQHKGPNNGNYRGGDVPKACGICGKTFYERASVITKRMTCGDDVCSRKWQGLVSAARGQNKRSVPCDHCGAELRLYPSQVNRYNYCNRFCHSQHHGAIVSGVNNARWNGGTRKYYMDQARIRDNQRCVICGFDFATDVHHIIPISKGGTDEFSNLITLCPNHHRLADLGIISVEHLRRTDWEPDHVIPKTAASH